MKNSSLIGIRFVFVLGLMVGLLPSLSWGQAGQRGGGGAGMNPRGLAEQLQKVLDQLDLSADQKTKIDAIMKKTKGDVQESMQGMQDAEPADRRAKMQEIMKMMTDSKEKIEGELTPEQLKKFFPLNNNMLLKRATDMMAAMKTAGAKLDVSDDVKKQVSDLFDDTGRTLDGFKEDANAVTDSTGEADFQQKLQKAQFDVGQQLRDILGQEDAMKVQQAGRAAGGIGAGGGAGAGRGQAGAARAGGRRKAGATSKPVASTQP